MKKITIPHDDWLNAIEELSDKVKSREVIPRASEQEGFVDVHGDDDVIDNINLHIENGKLAKEEKATLKAIQKQNKKTAGDKVLQKLGITDEEFFDVFGFWINEPTG